MVLAFLEYSRKGTGRSRAVNRGIAIYIIGLILIISIIANDTRKELMAYPYVSLLSDTIVIIMCGRFIVRMVLASRLDERECFGGKILPRL